MVARATRHWGQKSKGNSEKMSDGRAEGGGGPVIRATARKASKIQTKEELGEEADADVGKGTDKGSGEAIGTPKSQRVDQGRGAGSGMSGGAGSMFLNLSSMFFFRKSQKSQKSKKSGRPVYGGFVRGNRPKVKNQNKW